MRALMVCESMYGNSRAIAESIRDGLAETMDVDLIDVGQRHPAPMSGYDLVVLGGPTHAFGMSTPASRAQALEGLEDAARLRVGVREWLPNLAEDYPGAVAAFDTRMGPRRAPGAASRAIARRLRRGGHRPIGRKSFVVAGPKGPPKKGELHLARIWGTELGLAVRSASGRRVANGGAS